MVIPAMRERTHYDTVMKHTFLEGIINSSENFDTFKLSLIMDSRYPRFNMLILKLENKQSGKKATDLR